METPSWCWDEFKQIGTDYADPEEVRQYDKRMASIRQVDAENRRVIDWLGLRPESTLLELGAGTGAFAVEASRLCRQVYAYDISDEMLAYASDRACRERRANIEFRRGGFLTFDHKDGPVDAVVSQMALHHLPDFWKGVALARISSVLGIGGKLYLADVVFAFPPLTYASALPAIIAAPRPEMRTSLEMHIRHEFSTYDWIMEGLLQQAGFSIEKRDYEDAYLARYLCLRQR